MPENRGPLLPLTEFQALLKSLGLPARWEFGLARNRYSINADAVLNWLGRGEPLDGWLSRLIEGIGRDGLDPGNFWWARARMSSEGTGS
jgi:transglutaminase-like putative cysteine protease